MLALRPAAGVVLDVLLLVLLALDVRGARRAGLPQVTLELPRRIPLGDSTAARLALQHAGRATLGLRCVVDVPRALATAGSDEVRAVRLPPHARASVEVPLRAARRGRFALGPVHLRVAGPLGLAWRQVAVGVAAVTDVVPGLRDVRVQRRIAVRPDLARAGAHRLRHLGDGRTFESLRDYVRGDDPRRLDWKASARHARLIVRQHEAERSQTVMLCLDAGRLMAERCGERQRLDHALAAALVLADVARAWRDKVGLLVFSDRLHLLLPPERRGLDALLGRLATVAAHPVEPDYPRALTTIARTLTGRALVIVFSDAVDPEVSAPLAAGLARLGRRHLALLVALRNPALVDAAGREAADAEAVYRRAAAAELVVARARALAGMREAGVRVADVAPEQAVPETVRRYLDVKRRGLL